MTAVESDPALLPETAYRHVRDRILAGDLAPGAPLSVPRLARELGISRSPAREAIAQLIAEGLAVHVPYAGARVVSLAPDAVAEVLAVREVLDGLAARLAAERMAPEGVTALGELLAQQERNTTAPVDRARDAELDIAFHGGIRTGSGNDALDTALGRIEALAHLQGSRLWTVEDARRDAVTEHRRIWEALAAGDPDAAETAARAHVRAVAERIARS